jgi:DNA-binding transcriptional LysR family regulator
MDAPDPVLRRLKLNDLRTLRAVAQHRSMARAAEQLHVSQPAVSKAIANLEAALGVRLLDRTSTGVEPTTYGAVLIGGGAAVFDELQQRLKQIRFMQDPTSGELRIGCNQPQAAGFVAATIERLAQKHPGLRFHVEEADTATLKERELRTRRIEVLVGRTLVPAPEPDIEAEALFHDQLFVVASRGSPWTRRRSLRLADLSGARWTLTPHDSVAGILVREAFAQAGVALPEQIISTHSVLMHLSMVSSGRCLGVLPGSMLRFRAETLGLKKLPVHLVHRQSPVGILTLKDRMLSPFAQLFIEAARTLARTMQ